MQCSTNWKDFRTHNSERQQAVSTRPTSNSKQRITYVIGEYLVLLLEIHPSASSYVNGHGQGCPPKAPSGTGGGTGRTRPSSLSLEEAHLLIWKATAWSTASNWAPWRLGRLQTPHSFLPCPPVQVTRIPLGGTCHTSASQMWPERWVSRSSGSDGQWGSC